MHAHCMGGTRSYIKTVQKNLSSESRAAADTATPLCQLSRYMSLVCSEQQTYKLLYKRPFESKKKKKHEKNNKRG